ncbi:glycosyltransferase family 4 protein [Dyadobacter bucti]|uniref:glycosyltransferase family 4 protein n=1 Tax=Dyadobacter bucti TaxID=2572203 RepID=UPI00110890D5|nr:glycosyltransferase family 4 protein [Dyadobacter bucti]
MHILLIHQFFLEDGEGGGSRWNEMSRIWVREGHQVTVLAGMGHYMGCKSEEYKGQYFFRKINSGHVTVIRSYVSYDYNRSISGRLRGYLSFTFSSIWAGIFYAKDRYDVILVTSPPLFTAISAIVLSWFKHLPIVMEIRDLWPESVIDTGILTNRFLIKFSYRFEKYICKKARLISVLTPAFRDVLIRKGIAAEKIALIPNAADFYLSEKIMADFDVNAFRYEHNLAGKFVILYVGAHGVANHLVQMIQAAELLKDTNALFLLIGDGMQKEMLIQEVMKRDLANIRFLDTVDKSEVFKYILASNMGASVLKKTETFKTVYSNKTFDYFSCKKPILMAIDGISRKLVEDACAGIFVEPENPEDFAEKIRFYMQNPDLLPIQGENGYRYAKTHFDREALSEKYMGYLKSYAK